MSQFNEYYLAGHFIDVQLGDGQFQQFRVAASKPKNIKIEGDIIEVIEIAALEAAQSELLKLSKENEELKYSYEVYVSLVEPEIEKLTAALKVAEDTMERTYRHRVRGYPTRQEWENLLEENKNALAKIKIIKKGLG